MLFCIAHSRGVRVRAHVNSIPPSNAVLKSIYTYITTVCDGELCARDNPFRRAKETRNARYVRAVVLEKTAMMLPIY